MSPEQFVSHLSSVRATAILRTPLARAAAPAMEAAVRGGFSIIEFTLNTPGALELIASFAQRDGLIVGAGTVLSADDARAAVDAGAQYIVSPVVDEAVIEAARAMNVAAMPGTYTATEMFRAHRAGAPLVKLFPAPGTGPKYVKSIFAPMPFLRIVPTNGIHENNAAAYLKAGAFAVGFTTALFDGNELASGEFDRTEDRARRLLAAIDAPRI
jgi:2-dehydro-3-deoxyphosphogluconate aldolase/(4S)-4-hydroxy-2-oxoglutarate aldolase